MKHPVARARLTAGIGALTVGAGLLLAGPAAQAAQQSAYTPTAADFKNCPAIPKGAQSFLWNCVAIIITDGELKIGGLSQKITKPITVPVAVGLHEWKLQMVTPQGGFKGEPIEIPKESLPLPISGVSVQVEQAGEIKPGRMLIPDVLPLKVKVNHFVFGDRCYIGGETAPVNIKPGLSQPGLTKIGDKYVIKARISDNTFTVPAATGCGILNGALNRMLGLPSDTGKNAAALNTVIRVKNYAFGENTQGLAKERGIRKR